MRRAGNGAHRRVFENAMDPSQPFRGQDGIGINTGDEVSVCCIEAAISSMDDPLARFPQQCHETETPGDRRGVVAGIVIYYDHFVWGKALGGYGLQAGGQMFGLVVYWDDDTNALSFTLNHAI